MATFLQWSRSRPVRRVTWVCGPEPVLAGEVLRTCREAVGHGRTVPLFAGQGPDRDIWDQLLADPPPGGRLAVVHDAEKLADLAGVAMLAAEQGTDTAFTVFASAADDFDRAEDPATGKQVLAPHLAALQAARCGQLIRCCAPSREEDQVALVTSWWPGAGRNHGYQVLTQCGGSLTLAWQACDKAARAGLPADAAALAAVCVPEPGTGFADRLIAGDKAGAIAAAQLAGHAETGAALGLLASRLTALAAITDSRGRGEARSNRFLERRLAPHAAAYPPDRVRRCRELLALAESAHKGGAGTGVAESVVALW